MIINLLSPITRARNIFFHLDSLKVVSNFVKFTSFALVSQKNLSLRIIIAQLTRYKYKYQQQRQIYLSRYNYKLLAFASIITGSKKMEDCKGVSGKIFEQADKLFDDDKFDDLLDSLKSQPNWQDNEQILWRVARAEFTKAKKIKDSNPDEYKKFVAQAYEYIKKSLSLNDKDGRAHKWAAILLNEHSSLQGTKEKVLQVLNVRNHMEDAIKYNPTDATSHYLLGEWHYGCNQVSWWERKLASVAFGKLPDADMEKGLECFKKAEEIEPDFYSKNKVMLAKTLIDLKRDQEKALELLKEVVSKYSKSEKWDDKEAVDEATKILKSHKAL